MDETEQDLVIASMRDLIPDDAPVFGDDEDEYLFTDAQLLRLYNGVGRASIVRASGFAMISVGNSEAMILKVIKTTDLSTNGATLQAQWGARGEYYIGLADKADDSANESFFQIVDFRRGLHQPELTEIDWGTF